MSIIIIVPFTAQIYTPQTKLIAFNFNFLMCVCVCVCVREREREREGESSNRDMSLL